MANINNLFSDGYKTNPIREALVFCYRFINEVATCEFEKQGRLITLYGKTKDAADEAERLERETCRTLLANLNFDLCRMIAIFMELPGAIENVFSDTPLFGERNEKIFPKVKSEDVAVVRKKLEAMEILPQCGDKKAKRTTADLAEFAFIMKDLIFIDMARILRAFQNLAMSERVLMTNPDKLDERYQLMMKDYQENEWQNDQAYRREELDDYICQYGYSADSLKTYLKYLERDALNQTMQGNSAVINDYYLNQNDHVSYIYHSRKQLTLQDVKLHFYFVNSRKMVMEEIELYKLKQPVPGAEADLFTCRAAKELAEQLIPVIKDRVVFHYSYQYAAWVKALMDLKMIYPNKGEQNKRNGTLIVNYIYKMFGERIDKSTLFSYISKDEEFSKIRDQYDLIISLYEQTFDERIELLRKMV